MNLRSSSNALIVEIRDMMAMMKVLISQITAMTNLVISLFTKTSNHLLEIKSFLNTSNVDLLLVSETHFTSKTYFQISNYKTYHYSP